MPTYTSLYSRNSILLALGLSVSSFAQAKAVISFNVDVFGTIPTGPHASAGAVDASWWNNSWSIDENANLPVGTYSDLMDNAGEPTSAQARFDGFNLYHVAEAHPGVDADGRYDRELLNGYVNAGAGQASEQSSLELSGIPYAQYDVIIYFASDDSSRSGTVSHASRTFDFNLLDDSIAGPDGLMAPTASTAGQEPEANYATFANLTGPSQAFRVDIPQWGGIAGFQIVEVAVTETHVVRESPEIREPVLAVPAAAEVSVPVQESPGADRQSIRPSWLPPR